MMDDIALQNNEGFKILKVKDVLENDESSVEIKTTSDIPYVGWNPLYMKTDLHYIMSAQNPLLTETPNHLVKVIYESGFILGRVFALFDASKGPICVDPTATFWKIKIDGILPHYLFSELTRVRSEFFNMDTLTMEDEIQKFINTSIRIPDGDMEFSLFEQQRMFNEYRKEEIEELLCGINIGIGVNGSLGGGEILQEGKYFIEDYISGGGFGKIYRAHIYKGCRIVAVKELYVKSYCSRELYRNNVVVPEMAQRGFARQMRKFQREYAILAKLSEKTHYVPKVLDKPFAENNTMYYAMEYISGGTLWGRCKSHDLTPQQIINIICQVGIALHYAHDLDFLHLDVSPLNIMLNERDEGILIDFGSNKHYSDEDGRISSVGQVAKTKSFAAPEILQQVVGQYYMQSDVYSLAATLYSALTGDIPFYHTKDNDMRFMEHVTHKMQETLVDSKLSDVILKALSCEVEDRYPSVLEFLRSIPHELMDTNIQQEIESLKDVSGFKACNHCVENLEEQNSDYMPDYTSEEISD